MLRQLQRLCALLFFIALLPLLSASDMEGSGPGSETAVDTRRLRPRVVRLPEGRNPGSESPVEAGLRVLTNQQPASTIGRALAAIAYQGAAYDHKTPNRWRQQVEEHLNSLLSAQAANGAFDADLITHSLATTALAEAYAMTLDPVLREPVQRAVDYLLARSTAANGQRWWSDDAASPNRGSTRLALFAVNALRSAQAGGIQDGGALAEVLAWATAARAAGDGIGLPAWFEAGGVAAPNSDDVRGLMLLVVLGTELQDLQALAERIVASRLDGDQPSLAGDPELDWATTHGVVSVGGESRKRWSNWYRSAIVKSQIVGGETVGSWPAASTGPWSDVSSSTAMRIMSLHVYYPPVRASHRGQPAPR